MPLQQEWHITTAIRTATMNVYTPSNLHPWSDLSQRHREEWVETTADHKNFMELSHFSTKPMPSEQFKRWNILQRVSFKSAVQPSSSFKIWTCKLFLRWKGCLWGDLSFNTGSTVVVLTVTARVWHWMMNCSVNTAAVTCSCRFLLYTFSSTGCWPTGRWRPTSHGQTPHSGRATVLRCLMPGWGSAWLIWGPQDSFLASQWWKDSTLKSGQQSHCPCPLRKICFLQ